MSEWDENIWQGFERVLSQFPEINKSKEGLMSEREITVEPAVLMYAFRYALIGSVRASEVIVRAILQNWDKLDKEFKIQLKEDIGFHRRNSITTTLGEGNAWWNNELYPIWKVIEDKAKKEDL